MAAASALEAGDEAGISGVLDLSGIDAREPALELAREFGRELKLVLVPMPWMLEAAPLLICQMGRWMLESSSRTVP